MSFAEDNRGQSYGQQMRQGNQMRTVEDDRTVTIDLDQNRDQVDYERQEREQFEQQKRRQQAPPPPQRQQ